jgi:hypothetical protein
MRLGPRRVIDRRREPSSGLIDSGERDDRLIRARRQRCEKTQKRRLRRIKGITYRRRRRVHWNPSTIRSTARKNGPMFAKAFPNPRLGVALHVGQAGLVIVLQPVAARCVRCRSRRRQQQARYRGRNNGQGTTESRHWKFLHRALSSGQASRDSRSECPRDEFLQPTPGSLGRQTTYMFVAALASYHENDQRSAYDCTIPAGDVYAGNLLAFLRAGSRVRRLWDLRFPASS